MGKLAHWLSLRITDLGIYLNSTHLWQLGGSLELWADEQLTK